MATTAENTIQYVIKLKDEFSAALGEASKKAGGFGSIVAEGLTVATSSVAGFLKIASEGADILGGNYAKLGDVFRMIPGPVGEASAAIATFVGGAVTKLNDAADKFDKLSQKTGASVEFLSQFTEAADDVRVSSEAVESGLVKFSRALGGVISAEDGMVQGGKPLIQTLTDMGVEAQDASGKIKPLEQIMPQLADLFQQMPDGAQKTALAIQLFGRNGSELIPILNKGSEEIKKMMDNAKGLGLALNDLDRDAMKKLKESQDQINDNWKAFEFNIARKVTPALAEFSAQAATAGQRQDTWLGIDKLTDQTRGLDAMADSMDRISKQEFKPPATPMGEWADAYADSLSRVTKPLGEVVTKQQMLEQAAAYASKAQDALAKSLLGVKGALTGVSGEATAVQQLQELMGLLATGDRAGYEKGKAVAAVGEAVQKGFDKGKAAELLIALETEGTTVKGIFDALGPAAKGAYDKMQEVIDLYLKNKPKLSAAGLGGDAVTFKDIPEGGQDRAINPERYKEKADVIRAQVEEPMKMSFVAVGLEPITTMLGSIPSEKTVTIRVRAVTEGGKTAAEQQAQDEESLRLARAAAAAGAPRP